MHGMPRMLSLRPSSTPRLTCFCAGLQADADMLERAIIESLRDGGGIQEAEVKSEPSSAAAESVVVAAATSAKPEVSNAGPSPAAPATTQSAPVTTADLVQQGKSLEEIDDMLLQQVGHTLQSEAPSRLQCCSSLPTLLLVLAAFLRCCSSLPAATSSHYRPHLLVCRHLPCQWPTQKMLKTAKPRVPPPRPSQSGKATRANLNRIIMAHWSKPKNQSRRKRKKKEKTEKMDQIEGGLARRVYISLKYRILKYCTMECEAV